MKAWVLTEPKTLRLEDREPRPLGPAEVRVRPLFGGVCGTDLALHSGNYAVPLPLVLGHEFCAEVVEAGDPEFAGLVGQIVTAEINHHCLARGEKKPCRACRMGLPLHCQTRTVLGIISQDGAFQEEAVVLARNCHPLPEPLAGPQGVFIEPLAAALNAFERFPLQPGEFVVVLGAGRLGSLIALVAQKQGADVLAVCRSAATRERMEALGVEAFATKSEAELMSIVQDRTEGLGADRVVEATGDPSALPLAMRLVRPRGIVSLKSTPGLPAPPLELTRWVVDEVVVEGTRCGDFAAAIEFFMAHKLNLSPHIRAEFPFDRLDAAIEDAAAGGKVLIRF